MIKTGQILNDTYEIIERLGSGSGGIIFKAYHRRMRKYVAIKLVKDEIKGSLDNRSEIDILKNLKNECLPQVLDFVEDGGEVYTVMEFIEGQNFKQLISKGHRYDEKSVRKYGLQLCYAVEYLHSHVPPIIHSDIKPSNIMLTPQDNICLIDFNISMMSNNGIAVAKGGSKGFAAPEQFKRVVKAPIKNDDFHEETRFIDNDETEIMGDSDYSDRSSSSRSISSSMLKTKNTARAYIDIRTDIYGIGASLYYMLTARTPINGQLDFRGIRCSSKIKEIIEKAMNPDPARRYRNVAELENALYSNISAKNIITAAIIVLFAAIITIVAVMFNSSNKKISETISAEIPAVTEEVYVDTENEIITVPNIPADTNGSSETEIVMTAVPSLVGLTESEAIEACESLGFKYEIYTAESDSVKKGIVSSQQIPADVTVPEGMKIGFTVSTGKSVKMVTVPSVLNKSYSDAITALDNAGLKYKIIYEEDSRVQKDYVFKQSHKSGSSVEENTVITIYVNTYKSVKMVTVPSVLNKSYSDAISALDNAGLKYKIIYEDDSRVQKGYVFKQSHKSGSSVEENTVITIYVSTHEKITTTTDPITTTPPITATPKEEPITKPKLSLSINTHSLNLELGDRKYITVTATGSHNISAVSSDDNVAKISWEGSWSGNTRELRVYADNAGTATIKIYFDDEPSNYKSCKVTVNDVLIIEEVVIPSEIPTQQTEEEEEYSESTLILPVSTTFDLRNSVLPLENTEWSDYIWESDNTKKLRFTPRGSTFNTYSAGEVTITATLKSDTSQVYRTKVKIVTLEEYFSVTTTTYYDDSWFYDMFKETEFTYKGD